MSIFSGSNANEVITPDFVSPTVTVVGAQSRPSDEADVIFAGGGNDTVRGGRGDDVAFLGAGRDVFTWLPGEGNDTIEGQGGFDTLDFVGSNANETVAISANGARATFLRDVASVTMDLHEVERIEFAALGGQDNIVVNDLTGTDVKQVAIDLAGTLGGDAGDGQVDQVTVNATGGDDRIRVRVEDGAVVVKGLAAQVAIDHAEADDRLVVRGLAGDDRIDASGLPAGALKLTLDGGAGNDTVIGGEGDDLFTWAPGEGNDTVDGQAGFDTLGFLGSNANESIDISADGRRAIFFRDVAAVTMDLNNIERIDFAALGGTDRIVVNDLSRTDVQEVSINLAGVLGGSTGDGQIDQVVASGTKAGDIVNVLGSGTSVSVVGLPAFINIQNAEATDQLVINGGEGDDFISASSLAASAIKLTIDGGAGDDLMLGGAGADTFVGGDGDDFVDGNRGDDLALLGAGNDVFVWDPGDGNDVIEGQGGTDEMLFNGSGSNENIDISANGERVRFFRDIATVTMDLNDVERIQFNALGGADNIVINDLSGTDMKLIGISLIGGSGQANDGQQDTVSVNGTAAADVITLSTANGETVVDGLPAQVRITGADAGLDRLQVNGGAGDDVIDARSLAPNLFQYTALGGLGADLFLGSDGDDFFVGGDGDDVALMGAGDDTFLWNPGDDNDVVEGQAGFDTMLFNGANAAENIDISANGGRAIFFRDVASVTMDLNDVEHIDFKALGGADNIVVNDLSGTDVSDVSIDLAGVLGGTTGDGQTDTVTVSATSGDDVIQVTGAGGTAQVFGLSAQVSIEHAETGDRLVINGLAGDDVIDASSVPAGSIGLVLNGGDGDDILLGGAGGSSLSGGAGDDVLIGGVGNDTLSGGAGDNILIGGGGADVFDFAAFAGGTIVIDDFEDGVDLLRFSADSGLSGGPGLAADDHITQVGNDVHIDLGGGTVILTDTLVTQVSAADFTFG